MAGFRNSECRHDAIANIVIDGAMVVENDLLHATVEVTQKLEHCFGRMILGIVSGADDVGEQHRDILPADRAERLVIRGELVDDIGRKMPGEIGTRALCLDIVFRQMSGTRDDQRHDRTDNQHNQHVGRLRGIYRRNWG